MHMKRAERRHEGCGGEESHPDSHTLLGAAVSLVQEPVIFMWPNVAEHHFSAAFVGPQ
jgi:hypothetical protein